MLGKRKKAVYLGECVSKLFLDLSKAFDTINHDRLLARLRAYGYSLDALKLTHRYLINRKQLVQINNEFISENNVIAGFLRGSVDGFLLSNLFINDLVFFIQYCILSNYADIIICFPRVKTKIKSKPFFLQISR